MVIKTNDETCYFLNNGEKTKRYIDSPNISLIYEEDGESLKINDVKFDARTNVIIGRENGTTYIIDDGYRNSMIRAGYMVYKNYDSMKIMDKVLGNQIHDKLVEYVINALKTYDGNLKKKSSVYNLYADGYHFSIFIWNNIDIVKKNEERKINGLQFYPFDKNMDNYGTVYIAIYCEAIDDVHENKNTVVADDILKHIVLESENIRFVNMEIKQPLYFTIIN